MKTSKLKMGALALGVIIAVTSPTRSLAVEKPGEVELSVGTSLDKGDTPQDSLLLSAAGTLVSAGWTLSSDINKLKGSVRETLTDDNQKITIEAAKFIKDGTYFFLWGQALEMPLSGLERNVETLGGAGYEAARGVFIEAGYGYRRRLSFGNDTITVEEKTGIFYAGGEIDHTLSSGVTLVGKADYTFGEVTSIGRSKVEANIPIQKTNMKLRVSHENVLISPAPQGRKENNSKVFTSVVYTFN